MVPSKLLAPQKGVLPTIPPLFGCILPAISSKGNNMRTPSGMPRVVEDIQQVVGPNLDRWSWWCSCFAISWALLASRTCTGRRQVALKASFGRRICSSFCSFASPSSLSLGSCSLMTWSRGTRWRQSTFFSNSCHPSWDTLMATRMPTQYSLRDPAMTPWHKHWHT